MSLSAEDTQEVTRIAQQVAAESIRNLGRGTGGANVPVPVVRLATVQGTVDGGGEASVRPDGDENAVPAVNATGSVLEAGDRVLVSWLPPLGVYVTDRISRAQRGNWTPFIGGPSSNNAGASAAGHYTRDGHRVTVYGTWIFNPGNAMGTATSLGGLPFPVISDGDGIPAVIQGHIFNGSNNYRLQWLIAEGGTAGNIYADNEVFNIPFLANISTTFPFTWAAGHVLWVHGTYDTDAA